MGAAVDSCPVSFMLMRDGKILASCGTTISEGSTGERPEVIRDSMLAALKEIAAVSGVTIERNLP